ncbi:Alpha/Beta hydrolase protein [Chytridium lagenaria]|nr:Alpha/Beta hydrolase protein [Chytridium lagenaria]
MFTRKAITQACLRSTPIRNASSKRPPSLPNPLSFLQPLVPSFATTATTTSDSQPWTSRLRTYLEHHISTTPTSSTLSRLATSVLLSSLPPQPPKPLSDQPLNLLSQLHFPCVDKNAERESRILSTIRLTTRNSSEREFRFVHGGSVPGINIAYETWGRLNEAKDNVILLCTGLSGSSHAKSHEENEGAGWWEKFIGPGYPLDTNRFHIICTNVVGGCYGSTGPSSFMDVEGQAERYATRFPIVTIWDMVRAQFRMLDEMGIGKVHAVVGSSMGGMQSLAAASMYPDRVGRVVSISAAARQVLMSDPNWAKGFYYDSVPPHVGMKADCYDHLSVWARVGGEVGRKKADPKAPPAMCADFLIESYLDHQGEKWCLQYDANSFIYISKAMDMFDMSDETMIERVHTLDAIEEGEKPVWLDAIQSDKTETEKVLRRLNLSMSAQSATTNPTATASCSATAAPAVSMKEDTRATLVKGVSRITMPALVLGVQSDILFPCWQQREIAECLREAGNKDVTYYELDAIYGHDTFLIDRTNVGGAVKGHLENVILH